MTGVVLALAVAVAAWVRWEIRHAVPDPDDAVAPAWTVDQREVA